MSILINNPFQDMVLINTRYEEAMRNENFVAWLKEYHPAYNCMFLTLEHKKKIIGQCSAYVEGYKKCAGDANEIVKAKNKTIRKLGAIIERLKRRYSLMSALIFENPNGDADKLNELFNKAMQDKLFIEWLHAYIGYIPMFKSPVVAYYSAYTQGRLE